MGGHQNKKDMIRKIILMTIALVLLLGVPTIAQEPEPEPEPIKYIVTVELRFNKVFKAKLDDLVLSFANLDPRPCEIKVNAYEIEE
jgi:hypothetical protein